MSDIFKVPKLRVTRAKDHIKDLHTGISTFIESKPYTRAIEIEPETGNKIHKIKLTEPIPAKLLVQSFEIAEALRSVLDQCGYAAAVASGNTRLRSTHFPIADDDIALERVIIGLKRCQVIPPQIVTLFRSFNPYKSGNPLIWGLNQLTNGAKHRIIMPVGMLAGLNSMEVIFPAGMRMGVRAPIYLWDSEKDEIEICTIPRDVEDSGYNISFQMTVQIREIEGLPPAPASDVFSRMAAEVERIPLATEAEVRRLGWFIG